jgi:CO dehydrogenase maturation factor
MATKPFTIAIAGKGGTGKTTVSGLLIQLLVERAEGPVLAIDADPNANLNRVLGLEFEQTIGGLERETLKTLTDLPAGMTKGRYIEYRLQQLLVEAEGLDLLVMGRGEGPECYCIVNHILRNYMDFLAGNYRYMVMDNEAGMEHISRRTTTDVDALLVVSDANPVAIRSAERINELVDELNINVKERYLVLNNLPDHLPRRAKEVLEESALEILGEIPRDDALLELSWEGRSLDGLPPGSPALEAVRVILDRVLPSRERAFLSH